jgi:molybdopterin-guanine dinucleotide biosynthesis adapter protein
MNCFRLRAGRFGGLPARRRSRSERGRVVALLLAMTWETWVLSDEMRVIGLSGWSGAGKTTLLTRVIPLLRGQGLRVSVIKHAHHDFDIDVPGKDSWRQRQAGAEEVLVSSANRWALMHELRGGREPRLSELLAKMSRVDLVIVEGYKSEPHRKIEVHRAANGKPLLFPDDVGIVGVVSDVRVETALPTAHLDDIPAIAAMMRRLAIPVEDIAAMADAES